MFMASRMAASGLFSRTTRHSSPNHILCSRKKEGSRYALAGFCFLYAHQGNGVRFGEKKYLRVLDLVHDGLEGLGVVHGQVGEHLAVDLHASLVDEAMSLE